MPDGIGTAASAAASATPIGAIAQGVGAVTGLAQTLIGAGQARRANRDLRRLFRQRKAYSTPDEVFQNLQLRQMGASHGLSDQTVNYLTGRAGAGLAAGLGSATRLGADPNSIAGLVDQYYGNIFRIGSENEAAKMQKFEQYANALGMVAQGRDAEWQSKENIIKDQMAAAAARLQAGQTNIQSGLNLGIAGLGGLASSNLYKEKTPTQDLTVVQTPSAVAARTVSTGATPAQVFAPGTVAGAGLARPSNLLTAPASTAVADEGYISPWDIKIGG